MIFSHPIIIRNEEELEKFKASYTYKNSLWFGIVLPYFPFMIFTEQTGDGWTQHIIISKQDIEELMK